MNTDTRIEEPKIERDAKGKIKRVSLVFGPHHFEDVVIEKKRVQCSIGYTHHGVKADAAADVPSEFEKMIYKPEELYKDKSF